MIKNITKEYLTTAIELITGPRANDYGYKVINHQNIGKLWSAYLGVPITAHDVAICMALLKIARAKFGNPTPDTYIDGSAYMAIAGECRKLEKPKDFLEEAEKEKKELNESYKESKRQTKERKNKETWAEGYNKWKENK